MKKSHSVKVRHIRLSPSLFTLDVFVGGTKETVAEALWYYYRIKDEPELARNWCSRMRSGDKSYFKGEVRICIALKSLQPHIVLHECVHALWALAKLTNIEMNYDSQEWQAIMLEYMYTEVLRKNQYTTALNEQEKEQLIEQEKQCLSETEK